MNVREVALSFVAVATLTGCGAEPTSESGALEATPPGLDASNAAPGSLLAMQKVKHVIVVMQENHSFDNYFGALAYAPGSPYHAPAGRECASADHACVDGLHCLSSAASGMLCTDSNRDDDGSTVVAFHDARRCVAPDLDHSWLGTHREANWDHPNKTLQQSLENGFVRVNDVTEQPDNGVEGPFEDQTMAFYNQDEIPFYYELAQRFAISDRYFASVLGPTFPNRSYLLAATSFGHLTTSDSFPPPGGYKPITGTIFDLLESHGVSWANYFQDAPQGGSFRPFGASAVDPHFLPLPVFLAQAAGAPGVTPLPAVSFVDPSFGLFGVASENDEHPPTDIQRGQAFVSRVVSAVRNGPYWKDSVIFFTYDEHGGFYDHVAPPRARQGAARTPDGIAPGQCADLSNPPASLQPGGGAECASNLLSATDTTLNDAIALCPELAASPTGAFPAACASFDQLGIRVPFVAISPFSKPHYVSHAVGDHASILGFIEQTLLLPSDGSTAVPHLTKRDGEANPFLDMFDFEHSPSLSTSIGQAAPPAIDCTPLQ